MYRQFARILDVFKIPESEMKQQPLLDVSKEIKLAQELGAKNKEYNELKKVPKLPDEFDDDEVRFNCYIFSISSVSLLYKFFSITETRR